MTKNLRVLTPFLLNGEHQPAGKIVEKSEFPSKSDWQNILYMTPPLVEETDDEAGADAEKPKMPGKATR